MSYKPFQYVLNSFSGSSPTCQSQGRSATGTPPPGDYGNMSDTQLDSENISSSFAMRDAPDMGPAKPPPVTAIALGDGPTPSLVFGDRDGRVAFYASDPKGLLFSHSSTEGPPRWCDDDDGPSSSEKASTAAAPMAAKAAKATNKTMTTAHHRPASDALRRRVSHEAFNPNAIEHRNSQKVEPSVTALRMLPQCSPSVQSYVAANSRLMKIFRIREECAASMERGNAATALAPHRIHDGPPKFSNAYMPPSINSLSLCADNETLLCADDFQVHWYDLNADYTTKPVRIADFRPLGDAPPSELVTAASFHPSHGSLFLVAMSSGSCFVGDLRDPPCRKNRMYTQEFKILPDFQDSALQESEHSDILCSISDAAFLGANEVVTRDFSELKLWDLRNSSTPVDRLVATAYTIPQLDQLYDSDDIFHRFKVAVDPDSGTIVTGLWNASVLIWHPHAAKKEQGDLEELPSNATIHQADIAAAADQNDNESPHSASHSGAQSPTTPPPVRQLTQKDEPYWSWVEGAEEQPFRQNVVDYLAVSGGGAHRVAFAVGERVFVLAKEQ